MKVQEQVRQILTDHGMEEQEIGELLEDVTSRAIPLCQGGAGSMENAVMLALREVRQSTDLGLSSPHGKGFRPQR